MKKFKFLIKNSLINKIKSKAFIISMIITSVLIIGITLIPSIIEATQSEDEEYVLSVVVVHNVNEDIESYLANQFSIAGKLEIVTDPSYDATNFFTDDAYDVYIEYHNETSNALIDVPIVSYASKHSNTEDSILKGIVAGTKSNMLINQEDYLMDFELITENGEIEEPSFSAEVMGMSSLLFVVIFMFIIMSTQSLGAEILEEKSTKAIEAIISSVPAEKHFYAKIISSIVFTAVQLGIMLLAGLVGSLLAGLISPASSSILELFMNELGGDGSLIFTLIVSVLVIILGLALYLILFAFFASFANNNEEYQKAQTPMMIILMVIFYGSMALAGAQQVGLIKVLSFIPFFTPFLLPLASLMGIVTIVETVIILLVLVLSVVLLTYLILPAYKVSILSYSSDKLFKEISRSLKTARANKRLAKRNNKDK